MTHKAPHAACLVTCAWRPCEGSCYLLVFRTVVVDRDPVVKLLDKIAPILRLEGFDGVQVAHLQAAHRVRLGVFGARGMSTTGFKGRGEGT